MFANNKIPKLKKKNQTHPKILKFAKWSFQRLEAG
jgi:hypothetical protein